MLENKVLLNILFHELLIVKIGRTLTQKAKFTKIGYTNLVIWCFSTEEKIHQLATLLLKLKKKNMQKLLKITPTQVVFFLKTKFGL